MDMLKRVELESRGKKPEQVIELNLDNCRSTGEPEGITDSFTSLQRLSMINVGFTSLKSFPKLPALLKLELSDNRISGTLSCLKHLSTLTHLNLSGNKIKTLDALEPLADLHKLRSLDLFNNEVTKVDGYRESLFKMVPSLTYLDGFDCNDQEALDSDDEEGSGDEEENGEDENGENGNHDDEDSDDDQSDENDDDDDGAVAPTNDSDDDEESEEEIGLDYLTKGDIGEDESDDEDYDQDEEEEEIEDEDSDQEASGEPPSKVRKQNDGSSTSQ